MQREVYTPLCLHIVPQRVFLPLLKEFFMETIDDVIEKRDTFDILLNKVLYPIKPAFRDAIGSARSYWNTLSLMRQRQIFYTLREQKKNGVPIKENPRFAIEDCTPVPTNWNGKQGINDMMKTELMVIAKYGDRFGSYTLLEAWLFEMKEATAANFEPENLTGKEAERFNAIKKNIVR